MAKQFSRVIWWIKRDFRVSDNGALVRACSLSADVLPLYIVEPESTNHPDWSGFHAQAVLQALHGLQSEVERRGARLSVALGEAVAVLQTIRTRWAFDAIVAHEETGPLHTFARDRRVRAWCRELGIVIEELPRNGVIRTLSSREERMTIWRKRMEEPAIAAPERIPQSAAAREAATDERKALAADAGDCAGVLTQPVTEAAAKETLNSFLFDRARTYKRNLSAVGPAATSCSRMSVHLAWGTISMRHVVQALETRRARIAEAGEAGKPFKANLSAFRSRLFWHDHFSQRLEDEPDMERVPLNRAFDKLPYTRDPSARERRLAAWLSGKTGYPMVDACMRSFAATGWLNFRMRAMVVSFACHVLHLDWRDILWPMARLMADYVPGIHISQTQMQAGVIGINTFRIYKPAKQLTDHDPECRFVGHWVPELAGVAADRIKSHEEESVAGYQPPIVEYAEQTRTMRSALWEARKSELGRKEAQRVLAKHGSRLRNRRPARKSARS